MGAILICIAYLIAPTEAAKLHSTILVGLDVSLGLPRMVDKTIKGMIRQFRTHVAEKRDPKRMARQELRNHLQYSTR